MEVRERPPLFRCVVCRVDSFFFVQKNRISQAELSRLTPQSTSPRVNP